MSLELISGKIQKNSLLGFGVTSLKTPAVLNSLIVVNKTRGILELLGKPNEKYVVRRRASGKRLKIAARQKKPTKIFLMEEIFKENFNN